MGALILAAIGMGMLISLVFIGPMFLLVIETSITKGWKVALVLNMGALTVDLFCVILAYYGSKEFLALIEQHPLIYQIGALVIIAYGIYMYFQKYEQKEVKLLVRKDYIAAYLQGMLFNAANIGIVAFWFFLMAFITKEYKETFHIKLFLGIALSTLFIVDLFKIFLAKKLKDKLSSNNISKVKKVCGIFMVLFGIFIFFKR